MPEFMKEKDDPHVGNTDAGFPSWSNNFSSVSEIEEENSSELFDIEHRIPETISEEFEIRIESFDLRNGEDNIYVAVGKSDSSMDALLWALKHSVKPSSFVYLIHIFPEIRHIPTPLGKLPKGQVSPEQVESYMIQERSKRRELLQKFLDICSASMVKVDTILIESDQTAKAVLDLITILNIRKLVVGATKSSLRKLRKGGGIADQIQKNAPDSCEVKIICDGKEVIDQMIGMPSPRGDDITNMEDKTSDSFSCACFTRKFI